MNDNEFMSNVVIVILTCVFLYYFFNPPPRDKNRKKTYWSYRDPKTGIGFGFWD